MLPIKSCKKPGQVHINTPRVLSKIHQKTAFLPNISISLHKYVNDAVQKALFIEQNNSQRPYRPKIAGIYSSVMTRPNLLACNTSKVNTLPRKAARDGCATVCAECRRQRWWCHRVDSSYITTVVLVSELSDSQKQQTRDQ